MKLITKTFPDNFNLFSDGDTHEGSVLSSKHAWQEFVETVNSKYDGCSHNYVAEGGDTLEAIMIDDKRYSPEKLSEPLPLAQIDNAIKKRERIKEKLLYMLEGNHDRQLWKFGNLVEKIANELKTEYGTYTVKLTVKDRDDNVMFKLFDTHGIRGITSNADDPVRRKANLELILKRQLKQKAGDCAVMIKHHVHKLIVCKPQAELYLTDNTRQIKQAYTHWGQNESYIHPDARWYGCAGSFLKLYGDNISGYAEIAEYDPTEIGFLILKVRDRQIVELVPHYLKV